MSNAGAKRPRTNRGKNDVETCSLHSYDTPDYDVACQDCKVTCKHCKNKLPAAEFHATGVRPETLKIGVWKACCKACVASRKNAEGTLLRCLRCLLRHI